MDDIDTYLRAPCASAEMLAVDVVDAARWRALLGSARLRGLGSAGLDGAQGDYAHIGIEAWTIHPPSSLIAREATTTRAWLIAYADIARNVAPIAKD